MIKKTLKHTKIQKQTNTASWHCKLIFKKIFGGGGNSHFRDIIRGTSKHGKGMYNFINIYAWHYGLAL